MNCIIHFWQPVDEAQKFIFLFTMLAEPLKGSTRLKLSFAKIALPWAVSPPVSTMRESRLEICSRPGDNHNASHPAEAFSGLAAAEVSQVKRVFLLNRGSKLFCLWVQELPGSIWFCLLYRQTGSDFRRSRLHGGSDFCS